MATSAKLVLYLLLQLLAIGRGQLNGCYNQRDGTVGQCVTSDSCPSELTRGRRPQQCLALGHREPLVCCPNNDIRYQDDKDRISVQSTNNESQRTSIEANKGPLGEAPAAAVDIPHQRIERQVNWNRAPQAGFGLSNDGYERNPYLAFGRPENVMQNRNQDSARPTNNNDREKFNFLNNEVFSNDPYPIQRPLYTSHRETSTKITPTLKTSNRRGSQVDRRTTSSFFFNNEYTTKRYDYFDFTTKRRTTRRYIDDSFTTKRYDQQNYYTTNRYGQQNDYTTRRYQDQSTVKKERPSNQYTTDGYSFGNGFSDRQRNSSQNGGSRYPANNIVFNPYDDRYTTQRPARSSTPQRQDAVFYPQESDEPQVITGPDDNRLSAYQKRKAFDIAERMCEKYSASVVEHLAAIPLLPDPEPIRLDVSRCSLDSVPLVVGGTPAARGEFPHMAALGWPFNQGSGYSWNCGGTLVSERYVLTAAHCAYQDRDATIVTGPPRVVHVGSNLLNSPEAQVVPVTSVIKYPRYAPPESYHDIALLRLGRDIRISDTVRPACLGAAPEVGRLVLAAGWGRTESGGDSSEELRRVALSVWDEQGCARALGDTRKLPRGPQPTQLCAGEKRDGKDTCQGDSGGPLQTNSPNNRCIAFVVGITSLGKSCGIANTPALYTRVSAYIPFITQVIWPDQL